MAVPAGSRRTVNSCQTYWGSHGCRYETGHEGQCECDCCDCPEGEPCHPSCVAKPPYYGTDTVFYGDDAEDRGLPTHDQR